MDEIIEGVHPTRMELLNVKRMLQLAEKGHTLLKEKRDALMLEFMSMAREAGDAADRTVANIMAARESMLVASAVLGSSQMKSLSTSSARRFEAGVTYKNVMGVSLPEIQMPEFERKPDERDFNITLTHPLVDEVSGEYEKTAGSILELLEVESTLRALSEETRRTKRRVNALEYNIIPQLKNTRKYIEMRLAELDRECFHRLKVVKKKRG